MDERKISIKKKDGVANNAPLSDFDEILSRLKRATKVTTNEQLADIIGVKRQAISNARKRGEIPSNWIVYVGKEFEVSLDWILFGKGRMRQAGTIGDHDFLGLGTVISLDLISDETFGKAEVLLVGADISRLLDVILDYMVEDYETYTNLTKLIFKTFFNKSAPRLTIHPVLNKKMMQERNNYKV